MSPTTTTFDTAYASATIHPGAQYSIAKAQCTLTPYLAFAEPYPSGWTFKNILELIAGICTLFCLLATSILVFTHLTNWVRPVEQKQIIRVISFAPVFALFNFFSLWFYWQSWILRPFAELYEFCCLVAIFYLMVVYVSPDQGSRDSFYDHMQRVTWWSQRAKHDHGSLRWFHSVWICVFQVLPAKIIINVVTWVLNYRLCPIVYIDSKVSTGISVVQAISTSVCVWALLVFHRRMKHEMEGHRTFAKISAFKGFVSIVLIQTTLFTGLAEHRVFHRTATVSIMDFVIGTPSFMVCVEMFIVSLLFLWSFSASEYKNQLRSQSNSGHVQKSSVARAILDVLDIRDVLHGCWYWCKLVFCCGYGRLHDTPSKYVQRTGQEHDLKKV